MDKEQSTEREKNFKKRIEHYQSLWEEENKVYSRIANLRLVVLIMSLYMTYLLIKMQGTVMILFIAVMCYGGFCYLVYRHQKIKEKLDEYASMKYINEKYLKRINGQWHDFTDKGDDLAPLTHPYAYDLDVIGERSLFQKINTTHTWYGRKKLANTLLEPDFTEEEIAKRQKAIKELMQDLDFCQKVEGTTTKRKKTMKNPENLLSYAKEEGDFLKAKIWRKLTIILPWVIIILGLLGYAANMKWLVILSVILMFISYGFQFFYAPRIGQVKGMLNAILYELNDYVYILEVLKEKQFTSPYLKGLSENLFKGKESALEALKTLEKISNRSNITTQPIVAIPLNAILLWDLKIVLALQDWRKVYGLQIEHYLETIGEIESLISLSILGHVEKQVSFPLVEAEGKFVIGKQIGHPLIDEKVRVCNDVQMNEDIFVITGSNMSGKTTFLRTIGLNLILAYVGAPVLADEMHCSQMHIYTSMRIRDDLTHGISTFYAELTRIKQIIEGAKANSSMLFLIDEIFRGTNSNDRIIGATSVVKALHTLGTIGAITTHDMELCHLKEIIAVKNYHFSETYKEDTIHFDYQIKEGPSTTTNAKYLMKMVGIGLIE